MPEKKRPLYIPYIGPQLLQIPLLNKGSAFSEQERRELNLEGLLPNTVETIEEQAQRAYRQYQAFSGDIQKHIYLRNIQDTNETLFYHLITEHITEMMPLIYTPTVGHACEQFSNHYRRPRGLFISYPDRDRINDILNNATRQNVKVIVVTDGERILGLGDQGIGGMGIPIGKLSLYTSCGGISPAGTLPVVLDVGTNNPQRLEDPLYMGWQHPRIGGEEYDEFVDAFIQAVKIRWPDAMLQFEDFAQKNALPLLNRYKDQLCCFNDDIQGTAAVTVGSLLAACKAQKSQLRHQRVAFVGAGSAGCGIAEAIIRQMVSEGLSDEQARKQIFMVDRWGLLLDNMPNLPQFQQDLVQSAELLKTWGIDDSAGPQISLQEVMAHAHPTVLIGVSGVPGLFTEQVIKEMHRHCSHPIVFPLSNPTSRVEATPEEILRWTEGNALVASGSPFAPVVIKEKVHNIVQCNNGYIFPGIGLGVVACKATRITDEMLMAASRALAGCSPLVINADKPESEKQDGDNDLLPPLKEIHQVSRQIAFAVAKQAMAEEKALYLDDDSLWQAIDRTFWHPEYRSYKRTPF